MVGSLFVPMVMFMLRCMLMSTVMSVFISTVMPMVMLMVMSTVMPMHDTKYVHELG